MKRLFSTIIFFTILAIAGQVFAERPSFIRNRDTPQTYAGEAGKVPVVKSTEDGLEFTGGPTWTSLSLDHNTETLTGDKTFATTDVPVHFLDPGGADRNINLFAETAGKDRQFIIINTADGSGEDLTVKDDTPSTLGIIGPKMGALVSCDGTYWKMVSFVTGDGTTLYIDGVAGTITVNGATIAGGTNTFSITNGTASLDVAAAAVVDIDKSLTVDGQKTTITGVTQANTLTLNESFAVGDGYSGTLTFSGSGKTLTVEDTSAVNQDLTTDASPTFVTIDPTGVTDNNIPKVASGAAGFADSPLSTDGTTVSATGPIASGASPTPTTNFKDNDCEDGDVNAKIYGNLSDPSAGAQYMDMFWQAQINGILTTFMAFDASGSYLYSVYGIGIGTTTPDTLLEVSEDSADSEVTISAYHDTEATSPTLVTRKAEGTEASHATPVDDNAVLGTWKMQAYDGDSWANGAYIQARVDGTPADGDMPTEVVIATSASGSETPTERLTIDPAGLVKVTTANITAGSGSGVTVNSTGNLNSHLYKVTTTYAAYSDTDTTKGIVIATLPAKTKIIGFYADTTAAYTGGTVSAATLEVGITAEGAAEILAAHDVLSGAVTKGLADADMGTGMTRAAAIQGGYLPSWTGTTEIYATIDTTDGNTNALTAGSTTFYVETERY